MKKAITSSLAAAILAATGCTLSADSQPGVPEDQRILHLLNRVTFGPTPEDIALVRKMGINAYVEQQLDPRSIPQRDDINRLVQQCDVVSAPPLQLMENYSRQAMMMRAKQDGVTATGAGDGEKADGEKDDQKKALQKQANQAYRRLFDQMLTAKLRRNTQSPRQLLEVMTDFWSNHFNISINKGPMDRYMVGSFEQQAIRPYALGNFRDLLGATAHHPAMLFYLDNWQNTNPGSVTRGKMKGINENYARELMELHTLGVDGGYTQQDVVALAHVLTGLGFSQPRQIMSGQIEAHPLGSTFEARRHDFSDKQLLGHTIKGSGQAEIEQALDILAMHPSTAHHISYQLAQYFVADAPPASLVDRLSKTYLSSQGNIKAVMSELLRSQEFWDSKNIAVKYKSPYRYAISAVRVSGTTVENEKKVAQFATQLGQPIYGCLTPDGYKNTREAWLNPDGLLKRINFARAIAGGMLGPAPQDELNRLDLAIGPQLGPQTLKALANSAGQQKAALMLGSPEFMTY